MSMMAPAPAPAVPDILSAFNAQVDKRKRVNYQGRSFYHPVVQIKEWMLADNNLGKLLTSVYRKQFAHARAEDIGESVILFAILLRLGHGKWINIFQQYFNDNNLDAPLPESLTARLKDNWEVLDGFDKERWAFNPAKIEDMCNHSKAYTGERWILPFCRREEVAEGGTATVYGVMVPEDLVPDTLRAALLAKDPNRGYEFQDKDFGLCYQFAIKSYRDEYHSVFETETSNFSGIRGLKGVVECFGWYTEETVYKGQPQTTHNILLEYGDQDLDEYLALKYPPVLTSEIIDFWENIFGVATTLNEVHTFSYKDPDGGTEDFNGWHGDVKPSNILFAQGKFKLADFGFAKFEPKLPGKKPETSLDGVTYTYGAPECDPGRLRKKTKTPHTQKIDTWSFGCVLSSVATWVVLGSDAYQRQYPLFRKLAIKNLIQTRKSDGISEEPKALDGFHDGRQVLQAVKSWHQYLRNSIRKSDTVTREVIHLIESDMLRSDPIKRSSFEDLTGELRRIIQKAKREREELPPTDAEFLKALLMLDDMAPPDVNLQARITDETPARQLKSLGLLSDARTKRAKKTERIEEMVVPAKVAGRRKALETELRSQNQIYAPPSVIFEPADGPSDSTLRKGVELEHNSPPSPAPLTPQRGWQAELTPPATATEEKIQVVVDSPKEFHNSDYLAGKLPEDDEPPGLSDTDNLPSPSQSRPPLVTHPNPSWREPPSPGDYDRSSNSLPPTRSTASTVHINDISQYPIGQLREELDKQWSGRGLFDKMRGKIPVDNILKNFVQGRDIRFLVDNGWSMLEHWSLVKFVLVTLAMKIGALDDDGLDLLFTRGDHKEEGVKGSHIRSRFEAAMSKVAASDGPHPRRSHILFQTPMTAALRQILADYRSDTSKKLTIIVLTTGLWEREEDSEDVEELLAREIGNMAKDPSFCKERRLTIEFVSFGEYEDGLTRLRELDDNFSVKYRIPDVIDTESWQGDPDKMLLGSINASMDKQVTPPADHYRSDGASSHLNEPGSPVHYRIPSPGSGPRKSMTSLSDASTKKRGGSSGFRHKIFG